MKWVYKIFIAAMLFSSCATQFGKVMKSKDNEYKLKMAEQFYVSKKYDKAQQIFEEIMPFFKGDPRFEDMYYKYAYCAYYMKDYMNSENLFKTYTETFPNSSRAEESEYMRCFSYYRQSPKVDLDQTNTSKTISLMQAFINSHPDSQRAKDATEIMDKCRAKLELKEAKSAQLYFDLSFFKAAAVAYSSLMEDYPDSDKSDEYKLNEIISYYKYAEMSIEEKQSERYEKVLTECADFSERFSESKLLSQVNDYKTLSENNIKKFENEQTKTSTER